MKTKILMYLIETLLGLLTPDLLRSFTDKLLDFVEDSVIGSENKIDDAVLPICEMIRTTFGIPDNDDDLKE